MKQYVFESCTLDQCAHCGGVWFEYGETTSYGYTTQKLTLYEEGIFSIAITNLKPDTTYHFKAVARNSKKTSYGNDLTFHTPAEIPEVITQQATNIGYNEATLNGYLNRVGAQNCQVWFVYDTTFHENWQDYAYNTTHYIMNSPGEFSVVLQNLEPSTHYHFRAVASNPFVTVAGEDMTFKTKGKLSYDYIAVYNYGNASLIVTNISVHYNDGEPTGWLKVNPSSFIVSPNDVQYVNVSADASFLMPGIYHG